MKREDAMRKIRAMRNITPENGATRAEADLAKQFVGRMIQNYNIQLDEPRPSVPQRSSAAWDYWRSLLEEFRLEPHRAFNRASVMMSPDYRIIINLGTNEWQVQRVSAGNKTVFKRRGMESLRSYLRENAPRIHSFAHS
jgi:hypothetical protein